LRLGEVREQYYGYTATLSSLVRQLSFAGIALIWLLGGPQQPGGIALPRDLLLVGIALVVALSADFLQYAVAAFAWGTLGRAREKAHGTDPAADVGDAPDWINWPAIVFIYVKVAAVMVAYLLLGAAVVSRLG
jgi:hypothetical protein